MPAATPKIFEQIGASPEITSYESAWNIGLMPAQAQVHKGPALFPRIDAAKELAALENLEGKAAKKTEAPEKKAPQTCSY